MAPVENGGSTLKGDYQVVAWDLDTTGRRLIDEICQIGGFYDAGESAAESSSEKVFSQYVMPYKNPNPGARRSFGIKVVSIGRYRMLKDLESGRILKTKSEISALREFLDWLRESKGSKDGVLLICHEPTRKVLIPLLLEALYRYNLVESFSGIVSGFVNAATLVDKFGDKDKITSNSLRSLCKTVLNDTNPPTNSASDRSKVIVNILAGILPGKTSGSIDSAKLAECATLVSSEEEELSILKGMLGIQGTLRPIFGGQLRLSRRVRERVMTLRKLVAESGLDYKALEDLYVSKEVEVKPVLKGKLLSSVSDADLDELIVLLDGHFRPAPVAAAPQPPIVTNGTHGVTTSTGDDKKDVDEKAVDDKVVDVKKEVSESDQSKAGEVKADN